MTGSDWIFWGILGLMLAVRYADIAWCNGETAEGVRATRQDWWRYAGLLATVAGVMWAAVHGLAIYLHRS